MTPKETTKKKKNAMAVTMPSSAYLAGNFYVVRYLKVDVLCFFTVAC